MKPLRVPKKERESAEACYNASNLAWAIMKKRVEKLVKQYPLLAIRAPFTMGFIAAWRMLTED